MLQSGRLVISAVLFSAMFLAPVLPTGSAVAAAPQTGNGIEANKQQSAVAVVETTDQTTLCISSCGSLLLDEVHEQRYLRYLVKDFAPESLPAWEQAFAERQQAAARLNSMASLHTSQGVISGTVASYTNIGSTSDSDSNVLTVVSPANDTNSVCISAQPSEEQQARFKAEEAFTAAVEKEDASSIKQLLPQSS